MVSPSSTDHHNGEEAEEDEYRKGHHRDDAMEDSRRFWGEGEYDVRSHPGHSSPDEWAEGNARGSEHGGCSHGAVGAHAYHSHRWEDIHDEESETGKDHDSSDAPPGFGSGEI